MSNYTPIDLSTLPPPAVVETLSYESILASLLADLVARDNAFTGLVQSDPAYKILEVVAYRELILRQRINDGAKAVMLAYAIGSDLEQLGGLMGVTRKTLVEPDLEALPPVEGVYESDADLRRRIQLSVEGLSTAGPVGAYIYHALKSPNVSDVSIETPSPGNVQVTILSVNNNGVASAGEIAEVNAILNADDVRPLTDNVTVQSASIITYGITAQIYVNPGPDASVVLNTAIESANAYAASRFKIGYDINLSGVYAALHVAGVDRVVLSAPSANITVSNTQAARCTAFNITLG